MEQILIIEDDDILAEGVRFNLSLAGFSASCVPDLKGAEKALRDGKWDLLLLDVNLPDGDGLAFAAWLRGGVSEISVIFLTAKDMDEDMMRGFAAGADDYITKPFNVQILIQRVKAVLNRYHAGKRKEECLRAGSLEIDLRSWQVRKNGEAVPLTPTEFRLLKKFCENPGIVLTRDVLLEEMWDSEGKDVDEHTLTIFISRLRSKLADENDTYIRTVYGIGYQWIGEKGRKSK